MASKYVNISAFPVLIARDTYLDAFANCTIDTCAIATSYYYYRVSLPANAILLALFSFSLIGFIVTYALTRRGWAFTFAMFSGVALEVIGYAGRIMSWKDQWKEPGFLMQIVCLTIAPAFMAGGIYLCLRRIVYAFGPENSRIAPESYTRIFIPCDLLSLLLQAAGGGLASTATHTGKSVVPGDNIMVAGLALQVFTLLVFMIICANFALRTRRRIVALGGDAALDQNPAYVALRHSVRFRCFLVALTLATVCIFWRSVYRVAELGEGWTGNLIQRQNLFVGFEGVMVIIAVLGLNVFHPAFCFGEGMVGLGGIGSKRRERRAERKREKEMKKDGGYGAEAATQEKSGPSSASTSDMEPGVVA